MLVLSVACAGAAFGADTQPITLPTSAVILKKLLARDKWERHQDLESKFVSNQHNIQDKFTKDGRVEEHIERRYEGIVVEGRPFQRLIEKDGKPLNAGELKKEHERQDKFRQNVLHPEKKADDDDDKDSGELSEELLDRFNFHVLGMETINGRESYILTFLPKTSMKLPEKKRMDRIFNRLSGKVWIDKELYTPTKVDMHLVEPTALMGGLGSLRALDYVMEFAPAGPDTIVPKIIKVHFEGRRLFTSMNVQQTVEFSDYRRIADLKRAKP